ncbi:peptidase [Aphanothece hegewaldii CCALA 016]|uniref:Peptidase n=1 Tax=Aphanothece hegewaldii CCALA 016 TaxID=2107694 RepID=A0A2T1LRW3_9CHRO|nr:peptidase [Aphanothece hegewaldii]PSF31983.1 peptidase [Aphanothece hegewaldii CCALA 016]
MKRNFLTNFLSFILGLVIVASFFIFKTSLQAQETQPTLPALQIHPLPTTLEKWQNTNEQGDYFSSLVSLPIGALIWTQFPINVYLERPIDSDTTTASYQQFQKWVNAVQTAIQEWNIYLPLEEVSQKEIANIIIKRDFPPLSSTINPDGKLEIPRARTAQTRYDLEITQNQPATLIHRMTISISPRLSELSILSAARHEMGHALGIWGHSPVETDALYFSQVRNTPTISVRDINTLQKIYQQPTRLGWTIPNS